MNVDKFWIRLYEIIFGYVLFENYWISKNLLPEYSLWWIDIAIFFLLHKWVVLPSFNLSITIIWLGPLFSFIGNLHNCIHYMCSLVAVEFDIAWKWILLVVLRAVLFSCNWIWYWLEVNFTCGIKGLNLGPWNHH